MLTKITSLFTVVKSLSSKNTSTSEKIRVVIWALLAIGLIDNGTAEMLTGVVEDPQIMANLVNLGVVLTNIIWWLKDKVSASK